MDIYCSRCGEPWENDTLHDEVEGRNAKGEEATYQLVAREFRLKGCAALRDFRGSDQPCEARPSMRTAIAAAAADLMGDDMDGIASMMSDADYLGLT